ncbi:hypothetical protein MSG28_006077 [Choristoneura fumiferana]|uniref:Uncharacterized protein n=1 Tax=Choristoneura fumiferana TaxID=7141 RepID=A0ACC0JDF6_CHOFU|nr:hypothetical protein MSG28_006077 [Choristoneura fumiferana]
MLCLKKIAFVLSIVFILDVSGNLIRTSDEVITKDVPVPKAEKNEIEDIDVNVPAPVDEVPVDKVQVDDKSKPCTEIGQFCINHSDCCSNSCLGYMRRCVSGSG